MNLELKMGAEQTRELLRSLEINSFKESYDKYWNEEDGRAYFSSVCWLYCWGATKLGCQRTTDIVRDAFDKIFHQSFEDFGKNYNLVIIGNYRYKKQREFPGHNLG